MDCFWLRHRNDGIEYFLVSPTLHPSPCTVYPAPLHRAPCTLPESAVKDVWKSEAIHVAFLLHVSLITKHKYGKISLIRLFVQKNVVILWPENKKGAFPRKKKASDKKITILNLLIKKKWQV
jgi:hypothetical protein